MLSTLELLHVFLRTSHAKNKTLQFVNKNLPSQSSLRTNTNRESTTSSFNQPPEIVNKFETEKQNRTQQRQFSLSHLVQQLTFRPNIINQPTE